MTKRVLSRTVFGVMGAYALFMLLGLLLKRAYPAPDSPVFGVFKDLIPFLIAIPAAWIGYCFSRRLAYLQHLRALWSRITAAVQQGIQYTYLESPTRAEYGEVLTLISTVIDEIRGAFKNIGEAPGVRGQYPFADIKKIWLAISNLGFGDAVDPNAAHAARQEILKHWKRVQQPFLSEFDRSEPTYLPEP